MPAGAADTRRASRWTPAPPSRQLFGFDDFRPGQREAVEAARRRPRRARRHADRRGQVALLPAAGAHARRPDDRRLAARLAHAGPGRGARARARRARSRSSTRSATRTRTARRSRARSAASTGCSTSRPSGSPRRRSSSRSAARGSGCSSSTRRTASRSGATTSGPTTSASPTPRAGSGRRRSSPRPRRRRRRSRPTSRRGWRCATRCGSRPASTGRTCPSRSCRASRRSDKERRLVAALSERGRAAGDRLRGHARADRRAGRAARAARSAARCSPTTPGWRATRAPRRSGASWAARSTSSSRRTRSAWASTRPTCGRSCHEAVPGSVEAYYQEAGRAGRDGAPGAGAAVRRGARQGPARVLHPARRAGRRRRSRRSRGGSLRGAVGGRYDVGARRARRATTCDEDQVRAILGHLARAGVMQPAPSSPDRVRGRVRRATSTAARGRACRTLAGEAQRVRWRQYRAVWGFVEGVDVPARRDPAPLRRRAAAPAPEVPCCDVCDPSLVPAAPAPRAPRDGRGAAARDLDDGDLRRRRAAPSRPSAARARSRSCAAGARRSS